MPRTARIAPGGQVYHVFNRAAGKVNLFRHEGDFDAFQRILVEAHELHPIRILAWCVMSNHWHFVVWPTRDGQITDFFRWLTHTHAMRWRVAHHTVGQGHLYQGRFKCFPIQRNEHFLTVCRYVERNALSAGLVKRAEQWRRGSLWASAHGDEKLQALLSAWPVDRPADWLKHVNAPLTARELERVETSLTRNRPYGSDEWTTRTAGRLGLEHTIRPEGRPRKEKEG